MKKPQPIRSLTARKNTDSLVRVPLLCWDIAHTQLDTHQHLISDIGAFSQMATELDWQLVPEFRLPLVSGQTIVITDRSRQITWMSSAFSRLTGYQPNEMLGKSPALLQGPLTSSTTKALVRQRLSRCETVTVTIQNYRKDQTPYWCRIAIYPLHNTKAECTHFMAIEKELPRAFR